MLHHYQFIKDLELIQSKATYGRISVTQDSLHTILWWQCGLWPKQSPTDSKPGSKISISFQDEDSSCRIQSQSLINLVKFLLGQLLSLRPASTHSLSHCKTLPWACWESDKSDKICMAQVELGKYRLGRSNSILASIASAYESKSLLKFTLNRIKMHRWT